MFKIYSETVQAERVIQPATTILAFVQTASTDQRRIMVTIITTPGEINQSAFPGCFVESPLIVNVQPGDLYRCDLYLSIQ